MELTAEDTRYEVISKSDMWRSKSRPYSLYMSVGLLALKKTSRMPLQPALT